MPRPAQWANWTFDYGWIWWPSGLENKAGHVRVGYLEANQWWELPIRTWDAIAQKHMSDRHTKPGQPIRMPNGAILEVSFPALDDEADALVARAMHPNTDRTNVKVRARDGTPINGNDGVPRDWWEGLAAQHVQRRKIEPPVVLNLGDATLTIAYECFDAMVKDFVRNQRDRFISAGKWPELLIHEGYSNPAKPGPLPVDGRANAFGQGATVVNPAQQVQGPSGPGSQQVTHPAIEQQELI
jgi:hypothetical protein